MVKGASVYNPWRNPEAGAGATHRAGCLLQQQQVIDQELYDMLSARPLGVQPRGGVISAAGAMQMVRQELQGAGRQSERSLRREDLTTHPVAQDAAEKAATEGIPALEETASCRIWETAMVVVDRFTGEVRAMVGGAEPQFAGYNRDAGAPPNGLDGKTATYLTALSQPNQYRLNTDCRCLSDSPV